MVSAEQFSHGTGTLRCLQKEIATYRHWSVSLWPDPDDVPHCWILSPDKTEWRLISATLCCFVADQLWFMTRIREEEEWKLVKYIKLNWTKLKLDSGRLLCHQARKWFGLILPLPRACTRFICGTAVTWSFHTQQKIHSGVSRNRTYVNYCSQIIKSNMTTVTKSDPEQVFPVHRTTEDSLPASRLHWQLPSHIHHHHHQHVKRGLYQLLQVPQECQKKEKQW